MANLKYEGDVEKDDEEQDSVSQTKAKPYGWLGLGGIFALLGLAAGGLYEWKDVGKTPLAIGLVVGAAAVALTLAYYIFFYKPGAAAAEEDKGEESEDDGPSFGEEGDDSSRLEPH